MALRRFDEAFLRKLEYLSIVARRVFGGGLRADRRSRKVGAGIEFADHRAYTAGDDLRYLDWAVYARLERLLLRLFEEEEDLHVYLLVDVSASMGASGKLEHATRIAAALAYVGLSNLDRVSIVPLSSEAPQGLRPTRGRDNILPILRFLESLEPRGTTSLQASVDAFVRRAPRPGLAVLLSDFYDLDGYAAALDLLRYRRHEPTAIHLWSAAEATPSLLGDVELVDLESGDASDLTVDEKLLAEYEAAHRALTEGLERHCATRGVGYVRADVAVPFDETVLHLFRRAGIVA
jgi:uncharacterized protein (DUF58 family)